MPVVVLFLIFVALLVIAVPVSITLGITSVLPSVFDPSFTVGAKYLIRAMFGGLDSFPLLAVPMFVLSGIIMAKGGISKKLFDVFAYFLGKFTAGMPFVVQNTAPQVSFMGDLAVFDLPCVFDSLDECREKIDNPEFYELISNVYTEGGYHLLGMADQGFRVMSTNKPVYSFSDFKGQKIRTMENSYHLAFWKAIGANPTPMSFSEVYIGLQQHTIDAQENPYEVIVSNNLYEQQDYVVETNHLPHLISLIVNDDFFKDLPADEQEIMTKAAKIATEYAREQSDARIADKIATIEESGTKILTLDDQTRAEIRKASKSVYESIEENIDPAIYNAYMDGIE